MHEKENHGADSKSQLQKGWRQKSSLDSTALGLSPNKDTKLVLVTATLYSLFPDMTQGPTPLVQHRGHVVEGL